MNLQESLVNKKNFTLEVIFENNDMLAVNKPAGILVHPVIGLNKKTLVDFLVTKHPEIKKVGDEPKMRPGIVHRLDKDTSGVVLVAKTQDFFDYIKKMFQNHEVKKEYVALVHGHVPEKGVINTPIGLKPGTVKRTVRAKSIKMVKDAITEYLLADHFLFGGEKFSLVRLIPKTGRTHQLRVHLSSINFPIVGDQLYGKRKNPWNLNRQFLHAESIEFNLLGGERIKIEADMPEELKKILKELKNHSV